jgi:hypothetical protein
MTWWVIFYNFMRRYENSVFEAPFEELQKFHETIYSFSFLS